MKTSILQKILEDAKMCANIVIVFCRYTSAEKALAADYAGTMLEHFVRTDRIVIVKANQEDSTLTIAKTLIFKPQDAAELARHIAGFVSEAVAREIPTHKITLEQGEKGWQLRLTGGNKLLRVYFKAMCESAKNFFYFGTGVLSDKEGIVILDLSKGRDGDILRFAELTAGIFNTPLVI